MSESSLTSRLSLNGQGGGTELTVEELGTLPESAPLWLRFDVTDPEDVAWVLDQSEIPDAAKETLLAESTRPRFMSHENGILLVLRGINLNPGSEADDMVAVRIWLDARRIITCQRRALRSAEELSQSLLAGKGPTRPSEVLVRLLENLAEFIEATLEVVSDELEQAEDLVETEPAAVLRSGLVEIRRRAARIRRFLLPQREAVERLCRSAEPWLSRHEVQEIQQSLDALTRHLEDLDLARERALLVQDELQNRIAQQQNARLYLLSIITAIFLPLTFVTGLLGMNVAGLPGIENPIAFWLVSGGSAMIAVGLVVVFRFLKWF